MTDSLRPWTLSLCSIFFISAMASPQQRAWKSTAASAAPNYSSFSVPTGQVKLTGLYAIQNPFDVYTQPNYMIPVGPIEVDSWYKIPANPDYQWGKVGDAFSLESFVYGKSVDALDNKPFWDLTGHGLHDPVAFDNLVGLSQKADEIIKFNPFDVLANAASGADQYYNSPATSMSGKIIDATYSTDISIGFGALCPFCAAAGAGLDLIVPEKWSLVNGSLNGISSATTVLGQAAWNFAFGTPDATGLNEFQANAAAGKYSVIFQGLNRFGQDLTQPENQGGASTQPQPQTFPVEPVLLPI